VATEDNVAALNATAEEFPRAVSEFDAVGLTPLDSQRVRPPRVKESPISFECELIQTVQVGDGGIGSSTIVIGKIVYYHLSEAIYERGRVLTPALKPVSRLAGSQYAPVREIFELERPQ
jgi:flavin reductase (DIM6/NTAB) family NADH-FMN oxidoreductase RutF